jgi:hypothetical protein
MIAHCSRCVMGWWWGSERGVGGVWKNTSLHWSPNRNLRVWSRSQRTLCMAHTMQAGATAELTSFAPIAFESAPAAPTAATTNAATRCPRRDTLPNERESEKAVQPQPKFHSPCRTTPWKTLLLGVFGGKPRPGAMKTGDPPTIPRGRNG